MRPTRRKARDWTNAPVASQVVMVIWSRMSYCCGQSLLMCWTLERWTYIWKLSGSPVVGFGSSRLGFEKWFEGHDGEFRSG